MILQARDAFSDCFGSNILLLTITSAIVAFLISYQSYPIIIHMVKAKKLMDQPVHRSAHCNKVPTLGGVGVFIATSITIGIIGSMLDIYSIATMLVSLCGILVTVFAYSQSYLDIHVHLVVVFTLVVLLVLISFGVTKITSGPKRSKMPL